MKNKNMKNVSIWDIIRGEACSSVKLHCRELSNRKETFAAENMQTYSRHEILKKKKRSGARAAC